MTANNANNFQYYLQKAIDFVIEYGPKLLLAIIVLIIGLWLIKFIIRALRKVLEKGDVDLSLRKFLINIAGILLKVLLLISVASMVGIATTSFVAILGAAGLAVGLALQGSMANFAGGIIILIFKPFKVGDLIDAQGYLGTVNVINIFTTILKTPDNKTVVIPNGILSNGSMVNLSTEAKRRVDLVFGIGYNDDIKKTKKVLNDIVEANEKILKEPKPIVAVGELADSSVNFKVLIWCNSSDYWDVFFGMHEKVKLAFDEAGIGIPFPQRDIHIYNESINHDKLNAGESRTDIHS